MAGASTCGPRPGTGLPTLTFDRELTLHLNGEEIRIIALPVGHTDGDALVYFKNANVVETGDAFMSTSLTGPDPSNHGTLLGIIEALHSIIDTVPADALVVPGHGAQASVFDVRHDLNTLEGMRDAVKSQISAGRTLEEMTNQDILKPWKDRYGAPCVPHVPCDHLDAAFYLKRLYTALTADPEPKHDPPERPAHP